MNAAEITAIVTGIPAILAAVTALVTALRSSSTLNAHIRAQAAHTPEEKS